MFEQTALLSSSEAILILLCIFAVAAAVLWGIHRYTSTADPAHPVLGVAHRTLLRVWPEAGFVQRDDLPF